MPDNEHVPTSLEEVISEIAAILARGYMRHRNGRRIAPDSGSGAEHVAQVEESEAFTEKLLAPTLSFLVPALTPRIV